MTRLAILRPEPGNAATLARARALGLDAVSLPLFAVEAVDWTVPEGAFDGLLLSSANAVRFGGPPLARLAHLPVHAVGPATAEAALAAGLTVATTGAGGLRALLDRVDPAHRLLHLAGEDRVSVEGADKVTAVTVYRSRAIDPMAGLHRLAGTVALVHSPRAALRLGELVDSVALERRRIAIAAISPAAAAAAGPGWARVAAADRPDDDALLALAAELCKMMDGS